MLFRSRASARQAWFCYTLVGHHIAYHNLIHATQHRFTVSQPRLPSIIQHIKPPGRDCKIVARRQLTGNGPCAGSPAYSSVLPRKYKRCFPNFDAAPNSVRFAKRATLGSGTLQHPRHHVPPDLEYTSLHPRSFSCLLRIPYNITLDTPPRLQWLEEWRAAGT